MARVTKNILGEVRGKVGNEVRKIRNRKPYVASMPSGYRMSNEPHVVEQRNLFKINGKFASMVYSDDLLKEIWTKAEIKNIKATTAFNKVSSINYHLFKDNQATECNIITPGGFKLPVKNVKCLKNNIEVSFGKTGIKRGEKRFNYLMFIWCENPGGKSEEYYTYCKISRGVDKPQTSIIFQFDEDINLKINNYNDKMISQKGSHLLSDNTGQE